MKICCAGEVMIEMASSDNQRLYERGIAGDSFNTAVYLARAGLTVSYLTRLGNDALSHQILASLQAEHIDTSLIQQCPQRKPGIYLIDNDSNGERHFHYWRDQSAARALFDTPLQLASYDVFYFTGITLAVTRGGRQNLTALLLQLREAGCRIVFDPNFRPALWDNIEQARTHYRDILPLCDLAMPTLDDDIALWELRRAEQSLDFYVSQGITEVVIKGEELTAHAHTAQEQYTQKATPVVAVDTTGAGDAFNAGYLSSRLSGGALPEAITAAQQLAAKVVMQRGAILQRNHNEAQ